MPVIEDIEVTTCTIPTDHPESDGTLAWDATTIVIVEVRAGGRVGLGYTYGPAAIADVIEGSLAQTVAGSDPLDVPRTWLAMVASLRNSGRGGIGAMAVSAVDIALHDLRARLLDVPLVQALGRYLDAIPVYGSGGFCAYPDDLLARQLGAWAADGLRAVKMKVGRDPDRDPQRVRVAREAIGPDVALFIDANGAWDPREAVRWTHRLHAAAHITYVEEPVSSDDIAGLRFVRDHVPPPVAVAAGEYAFDLFDVDHLLGAVDVIQADVTRCGGITNFVRAGAIAQTAGLPLSAHCAPAISAHACCAVQRVFPMEYFHDHVRIEDMLFDGVLQPEGSVLRPDLSRAGHGLSLRRDAAARHARRTPAPSPPGRGPVRATP